MGLLTANPLRAWGLCPHLHTLVSLTRVSGPEIMRRGAQGEVALQAP
jgi:hypothetical protein